MILQVEMGLFTSIVVCVITGVLCIKLLSVDGICWVHCPPVQYIEPHCYLNDEQGDQTCSISLHPSDLTELQSEDWKIILLFINITDVRRLIIDNYFPEYTVEIRAFRYIHQVTELYIYFNQYIMSHTVLHYLDNLESIDLWRAVFPHFPSFLPSRNTLTYLSIYDYTELSHNQILRSGLVSGLSKLEWLQIYSRNTVKLADNTFSGLTALTYVNLRNLYNYETSLSPLVGLKALFIHSGELSDVTFLKRTPSLYGLTRIYLWYNKIILSGDDTFQNYTQLKVLNLYNNAISVINRSNFAYLSSLERLSLYSNQITRVPEDTFRDMLKLTYIVLGSNAITTLSSRTFEYLPNIRNIYMRYNLLHCDCSLQWMYEVRQEYGINVDDPTCATPLEHRGEYAYSSSPYTNCSTDLSYQCYNRVVTCPVGSYCHSTTNSYNCIDNDN